MKKGSTKSQYCIVVGCQNYIENDILCEKCRGDIQKTECLENDLGHTLKEIQQEKEKLRNFYWDNHDYYSAVMDEETFVVDPIHAFTVSNLYEKADAILRKMKPILASDEIL